MAARNTREPPACRQSCSATRSCATSSPFSVWTNSPQKINKPLRARAKSSASYRNPFMWLKSLPARPANMYRWSIRFAASRRVSTANVTICPNRRFIWSAALTKRLTRPACFKPRPHNHGAATKTLKVSVVSAEEEIFSGDAYFVELPGAMGALGILPGHAPLMTRIRAGAVQIKTVGGAEELIFVAGGILEVQPDEVTVLADTAVRGEDLEEAKAQQARQTAEAALRNTRSKFEYATVAAELETTLAQLAAIRKLRRAQIR